MSARKIQALQVVSSSHPKIELGGQSIEMKIALNVKESGSGWEVTEVAKGAMGEMSDATWLEKGSLVLTKRSIKQGPIAIDLAFKNNKADGTMSMNGQSKPVSADLGGALFADGAGAHAVMGTLPLADGYTTTFRNFDVQKQKVDLKQLKVAGSEKVTVPAGSFDAFKVEVVSADGDGGKTTVWIAKDSRKVVKMSATLPQMNGATLTSELTQ